MKENNDTLKYLKMNKFLKEETIEGYTVKYKKHIFSKAIKITLKKDDLVVVTMPKYCPYKNAKEFLLSNFEKIKSFETNKKIYSSDFKTKFDSIKIIADNEYKTIVKKSVVYFYYPKHLEFSDKDVQKNFNKAYLKALQLEAKNYLPDRIKFLSEKFGFKYNKLALRNQRTRFGSCSFYNNINLNINLMKYDFDIIDYVIIHELVHTKIKNHSKSFWKEVEKYCPDYKNLRKMLKSVD